MAETRWWKYVQNLIGSDTAQDAAKRAGFSKSAFTRWKQGANADPEFVVQLARAYNVNVVEALAESGLITDDEAALRVVSSGKAEILHSTPITELAEEIIRKAKELPRKESEQTDNVRSLIRPNQPSEVDDEIDDLDLPYVAHEPSEGIDEDADESKYDV